MNARTRAVVGNVLWFGVVLPTLVGIGHLAVTLTYDLLLPI